MCKIKVLHQVLNPSGSGGVSAEYRALSHSLLTEKYEFIPMILNNFHSGISPKDISFYRKKIKEASPDIIHVRGAAVDGLNAVIAAKLAGKGKVIVTVHGMYSDLVYISKLKRFISKYIIERLIFGMADGISCVCKAAEQRPYFNKYRRKMLPFVYNRMPEYDTNKKDICRREIRKTYGIASDSTVALYVGRITREKGLDILTEAINSGKEELPSDFTLIIVGEGDYLNQLKVDCKKLKIKTIFTGDRRDVESFYFAADFFIQPSLHENHSIALLEAYAAGLPAIATYCGGNPEIVEDNVTGIIVPTANPEELKNGIIKMCNTQRLNAFRENIKNTDYEQFSNSAVDAALDRIYTEIRRN